MLNIHCLNKVLGNIQNSCSSTYRFGKPHNSFPILKVSFKLISHETVLENLHVSTYKICRFYQFSDELPTVIKLMFPFSFTYFGHTVPRSNSALLKQSLI